MYITVLPMLEEFYSPAVLLKYGTVYPHTASQVCCGNTQSNTRDVTPLFTRVFVLHVCIFGRVEV